MYLITLSDSTIKHTMKPAHTGIAWAQIFSVTGGLCFLQVLEIKDFLQLHTQYISTCVKG